MQELPKLSELSHKEKDDQIRSLWSMLENQAKQIAALQSQVAELQSKLNKNSRNSSKPSSSDGLNKPATKSLRVAGKNPTGGQKGHAGRTLREATQPNKIVVHGIPDQCHACHQELPFAYVSETRQVFDLPVLEFVVTEHHAMQATDADLPRKASAGPLAVEAEVACLRSLCRSETCRVQGLIRYSSDGALRLTHITSGVHKLFCIST